MTLRHHFSRSRTPNNFFRRVTHAFIAAASLAVSGCADQGYSGYAVLTVTYLYTDQDRVAREQSALREAQDRCYFGGETYAQLAGPPQVVPEGGTMAGQFRATQSFYCVGMRGEG
jgi:hypothetical protein